VDERNRLDPLRLDDWLKSHVEGYAGPLEIRQFKGGQSNPTYELVTPTRAYVLRRKPQGKLLPSAHAVDREYRVISALHPAGFPVPRPHALCLDDSVIGTMFYVMDRVNGRIHWDQTLPQYDPPQRRAIYQAKIETLAHLHALDPQGIGLGDYGRPGNYLARQVERWSKQYRASQTGDIEAMDRLMEWLPATAPAQERTSIVHGDYRLDNMVFHPTEARVIAVLDWELSTLGDPLADLAYHLMQWDMPPSETGAGVGTLLGHDLARLGIPARAAYVEAYMVRTGLDPRPHLPVYLAYNFFRLAAILQGIVGRVRDGTATSENAAAMAPLVGPLAAKAWEFASEAGAR